MAELQLLGYYRSSASYRVRIALNLKAISVEQLAVNLVKGEQKSPAYTRHNPQALVPALITEDGQCITQSLAIMEYLDEHYPDTPPLLPAHPLERARVRALAQAVACEIAPLNNLRVLQYLTQQAGLDEAQKQQWYAHWVATGFDAVEAMLQDSQTGIFCHGDSPTMADCCLIPQLYNALRFQCDISAYPTIQRIAQACEALPAFAAAHPSRQPDSPVTTS